VTDTAQVELRSGQRVSPCLWVITRGHPHKPRHTAERAVVVVTGGGGGALDAAAPVANKFSPTAARVAAAEAANRTNSNPRKQHACLLAGPTLFAVGTHAHTLSYSISGWRLT
jgi:hypothetical protein